LLLCKKKAKEFFKLEKGMQNNKALEKLLGNYQEFFSDLLNKMKQIKIDITGLPMSHLLYRVATMPEYLTLRDKLKVFCSEFVETQFNGRAVSILILKNPLILEDGFRVSMIELPAPREVHRYPTGLESIGVVVGKKLAAFIQQYQPVLSGVKEHGIHCQPAFITFENEKTVKFYDISLREIVLLQGWNITAV
jgi:predicted metalloenzyme YecM